MGLTARAEVRRAESAAHRRQHGERDPGGPNLSFSMYYALTHGAYAALDKHATQELKDRLPAQAASTASGRARCASPNRSAAPTSASCACAPSRSPARPRAPTSSPATRSSSPPATTTCTENIVHLVLARLPDAPAGHQGDQPVRHPQAARGERQARPERRRLHRPRAQDGDQGLGDLRPRLRRLDRLPRRPAEQGHAGDVHLHERRPAARRHLGPGVSPRPPTRAPSRSRASACRVARSPAPSIPEKPADPILVHPDVRRMLLTVRAFVEGARALTAWASIEIDHAENAPDPARDAGRRRLRLADHAGDQGLPDRPRLRIHQPGAPGLRRLRLLQRLRRRAAGARLPHHPDLRGHQRHPGARPRGPQDAGAHRPLPAPLLPPGVGSSSRRKRPCPRWPSSSAGRQGLRTPAARHRLAGAGER